MVRYRRYEGPDEALEAALGLAQLGLMAFHPHYLTRETPGKSPTVRPDEVIQVFEYAANAEFAAPGQTFFKAEAQINAADWNGIGFAMGRTVVGPGHRRIQKGREIMTQPDIEAAKAARRQRIQDRGTDPANSPIPPSGFAEGASSVCPVCHDKMVFVRGLAHEARVQSGLLVVANLSAFVCNICGERSYDAPSMATIQAAVERQSDGFAIGVKLSKLARSNIGVYLPRDIQRHLRVEAGDRLLLQPVGHDLLVVEVERMVRPKPEMAENSAS